MRNIFLVIILFLTNSVITGQNSWTIRESVGYRSLNWSIKASFKGASRVAAIGFSIGEFGYVMGGTNTSAEYNDMFRYSVDSNTWSKMTSYPVAGMREPSAFVINNVAYVGLGFRAGATSHLSGMYKYDPKTNNWTSIKSFYEGRRAAVGFAIDSLGYIFGGFEYGKTPDNSLYSYSPTLNSWKKLTSMPGSGRSYPLCGVINGKAYMMGGMYAGGSTHTNDFYVYDPKTDKWTALTNYPGTARKGASSIVINDILYIGNGKDNSSNFYDWWGYDPSTGIWTRTKDFTGTYNYGSAYFTIGIKGYVVTGALGSAVTNATYELSFQREGRVATCGFSDGKFGYVFGGTNLSSDFSELHQYNPNNNSWSKRTSMPIAGMREPAAFAFDSIVYVGLGFRAGSTSHLSTMFKYNTKTDAWTSIANFIEGRRAATGFTLDSLGYIFGGFDYGNSPDNSLYSYSPSTDKWTKRASMPGSGRSYSAVATVGGKSYHMGGLLAGGSVVVKDFYVYDPAKDNWTKLSDFPGQARNGASAFAIGKYAIYGNGKSGNTHFSDWWAYNTESKKWFKICDFPSHSTYGNANFTIGGTGYLATGSYNVSLNDSVYSFNNLLVDVSDTFSNGTFCYGGVLNLGIKSGGGNKERIDWYKDGKILVSAKSDTLKINSYSPGDNGIYKLMLTGKCNKDSVSFHISPRSYTVFSNITLSSDTLWTTLKAGEKCYWYSCDSSVKFIKDTQAYFKPPYSGNFAVVTYNEMCSHQSDCIKYTVKSNELEKFGTNDKLIIAPNPSSFNIQVRSNNNLEFRFVIYSVNGIKLQDKIITTNQFIDVKDLKPGIYIVQLFSQNRVTHNQKLMIVDR